jgi:hypothetical protein
MRCFGQLSHKTTRMIVDIMGIIHEFKTNLSGNRTVFSDLIPSTAFQNMKCITLSILFFIGLTTTWSLAPLHAGNIFITPEQMSRVREATELAYNDQLIESFVRFESLHQEIPENPLGYFYMIAVLEKIQTDYFCEYRQKELRDLLKRGEKVGERYVRKNPNEALGHFFLGGIQGYY